MSNENQNIGPNTGGNIDPSKIRSYLKNIIDEQEDLSGVLKDTLRELQKTEQSYSKIQARIERITSGAIDVKGVQRDLNSLIDKEFIKRRQLEEIEKELGQGKRDQLESFKAQAKLSVQEANNSGKKKDFNEEILKLLEKEQDHGLTQLFLSEQSLELAKRRTAEGEQQLDTEKKLSASLGIEGKLLKNFADKLGIGAEYYEEMSRQARKLNEEGKKFGFMDKISTLWKVGKGAFTEAAKSPLTYIVAIQKAITAGLNLAKQGLDSLTGTGGPISNFVSPFSNLIKQIPFVGGLLGGLVDVFANLVDMAIGFTSKVEAFARDLGISYKEAKALTDEFSRFSVASGEAFLNVEKLQKSQGELSKELGINNVLSNQILADNIQLQEQAGLELGTRKDLAQLALISNQRQVQIFKNIAGQVAELKKSTGLNLRTQDVIASISKLSGVVGLNFAKYPEKLAKSLAITKALGMDFQKLDSIASGLLDFESSIASEFEAQLITGKDINLSKARQLSLDNDLTGLAVELNKQLGSSSDFINMNRIAQESIAGALKMSRDEVADMLKQQELFAAAGATDLKTFKEKIYQMEKAGTLQDEFVSKLNEEQTQYFLSSTATEKIAGFIDKIKQSFAALISSDQFKAFLDKFMNFLSDPKNIENIINRLVSFVSLIIKAVAAIVDGIDYIVRFTTLGFGDIDNKIPEGIRSYADSIGKFSVGGAAANQSLQNSRFSANPSSNSSTNSGNQNSAIYLQAQLVDSGRNVVKRVDNAHDLDKTKVS